MWAELKSARISDEIKRLKTGLFISFSIKHERERIAAP